MSLFAKNAFGLDISDTSFKLVWLDNKKCIKSYNEVALGEGLMEKGVIKDRAQVVEAVKKLISTAKGDKIKTDRAVACLPEPKTFIKVIRIPVTVRGNKIKDFILDNIQQHFPLRAEEIYIDWQMLGSRKTDDDLAEVLVGVAPRKIADDYLDLLSGAGLKVESLEIEAAAITNALVREKDKKNKTEVAPKIVVDLGANRSSLVLFDRGTIQFSISIPVSGIKVTDEIAKELGITFIGAEKKKIEDGLQDDSSAVYKIFEKNLSEIVKEIKRSSAFYSQKGGGQIEEVTLCGGVAETKNLLEYLSLKTKLKVALGNPFANIKPEEKQKFKLAGSAISFTTAIGLALSGLKI